MKIKLKILLLFLCMLPLLFSCREKAVSGYCFLEINGRTVKVEMVSSPEKRAEGLSGRNKLGKDSGMLFVFPYEDIHVFWMKDCFIDLDIAFIDASLTVKEISTMKKEPAGTPDAQLARYYPRSKVKYALEMNAGWFGKNQVLPESKITINTH